jgi:hypothetical protein
MLTFTGSKSLPARGDWSNELNKMRLKLAVAAGASALLATTAAVNKHKYLSGNNYVGNSFAKRRRDN